MKSVINMALVHCRECGERIAESAQMCPFCGARQNFGKEYRPEVEIDKDPNPGLSIVSFLWPFIGLILYIAYNDESPRRAKACGKWALVGVIIQLAIATFAVFLTGIFIASI